MEPKDFSVKTKYIVSVSTQRGALSEQYIVSDHTRFVELINRYKLVDGLLISVTERKVFE